VINPVIRTIFVDFGNVCATFNGQRFMENFSKTTGVTQKAIETALFGDTSDAQNCRYSQLFESLECGRIPPAKFFHELTRNLNCAGRIDYETFAHFWVDIFDVENAALDQLLTRLPQKKFLLSNTNIIVYTRHMAQSTIVRNHFSAPDRQVMSYRIGEIKPNPIIYSMALKLARVSAENALFIDDLPENIDAWRNMGGHGIVYHAGKNSIDELETAIRSFGLLA
jgi:putative hydrolase of the HAD superfamily